jgi:hypothetical protein
MKKQELIERIDGLKNIFGNKCEYIKIDLMIELVSELDEPEKVKVPQCVHKYIQEAKKYNWDLQDLMKSIDDEDSEELQRWFYHECNQETLARAWLDGYEVEEEKRYLVKVKGVNEECECLFFGELSNTWKFRSLGSFGEFKKHHTRKELEEAGFGWVFDCPGIEIEEVTD